MPLPALEPGGNEIARAIEEDELDCTEFVAQEIAVAPLERRAGDDDGREGTSSAALQTAWSHGSRSASVRPMPARIFSTFSGL